MAATDVHLFKQQLAGYKQAIDDDIALYTQSQRQAVEQNFGDVGRLEVDAYLAILGRGGKRIRGVLAMIGYEMCGGTDKSAALLLARTLEMLHAYILIIDDIQDQSAVRRGGPTAHIQLAEYHRNQSLKGSSEHFGMSIALNAALWGSHQAQQVLTSMDVDPELRLRLLDMANSTMTTTAHGQTYDILNEVSVDVAPQAIEQVLIWKTAQYTFVNPLSMGMALAGADQQSIDSIADYGLHAGQAFQITDDILGIFGKEADSGKSAMDDISQGKHTLIVAYALEHASNEERAFLKSILGNNEASMADFEKCKDVISSFGALDYAQNVAEQHVQKALASLDNASSIAPIQAEFLRGLAEYVLLRNI